jgi:cysteine synthase A
MKYLDTLDLIGNTPLVKLNRIFNEFEVYAKIEKNNLTGSIKDRPSLNMIKKLIDNNYLKEGDTIIEPTSGNTGISLAAISNIYKLNCIIVMPQSASLERRKLIEDYNASIVLVDGGMDECVRKSNELANNITNSVIVGQFDNPNNYLSHYNTIEEIISDLPNVDVIVSGIGTGGTITGIGKYIKEHNLNIELIGVEPFESPLITKGAWSKHKIQGIGANFIPNILDQKVIDKIALVKEDEAIKWSKKIVENEGLLVGISSGAVCKVASDLLTNGYYRNKSIVLIFPDSGERYKWK